MSKYNSKDWNIRCVHCGDVWSFSDYYCSRCDSHAVEETKQKPNTEYRFYKDEAMTILKKDGHFCKKIDLTTGDII